MIVFDDSGVICYNEFQKNEIKLMMCDFLRYSLLKIIEENRVSF